MAFVSAIPVAACRTAGDATCARAPRMALNGSSPMNRRAALRLAAVFGVGVALTGRVSAADETDRSVLKEDLGELKYNEQVVEQGPSTAEIIAREKIPEEVPEYVQENKEVLVSSEQKFGEMVAEEEAEAKRIRESFSK